MGEPNRPTVGAGHTSLESEGYEAATRSAERRKAALVISDFPSKPVLLLLFSFQASKLCYTVGSFTVGSASRSGGW
jgi:hypothetical protein